MFSPDEIAIGHVMNRTVRRCFLMGDDPLTGKNFDHCKAWMVKELQRLAASFGNDLLTYAVMSNHFHLVLRNARRERARMYGYSFSRLWQKR